MGGRVQRSVVFAAVIFATGALTWRAGAQTTGTPATAPAAAGPAKVGVASVYSPKLSGRHMADGERFHNTGTAAASRDLPLGTKAQVTNLATGKSAIVTIKDRGPFHAGRSLDVSKATANQIGITHRQGVAPVEITPVAIPAKTTSR